MSDQKWKQKRAILAQLWKDMAAAYGSLWTKEGGVETERFQHWLDCLQDFEVTELRDLVLRLRKREDKYPPTLPEVRGLLRGARPRVDPQNCTDEVKAETERRGQKLLAGSFQRGDNRIVKKSGKYVHQKRVDGAWKDQPAKGEPR